MSFENFNTTLFLVGFEATQGVASGEPVILGTRIMVWTIVEQYQLGRTVEEILWDFPQLSSAQIHDALSYYHDNRGEMDALIEQASYEHWQPIIERMAANPLPTSPSPD